MEILNIIGRSHELFSADIAENAANINKLISRSKFMVIGAAGSIGQAVTKEIFIRDPKCLHVVDISENNLVELVRNLRSSVGYTSGEFKTFAIDCGSDEYAALCKASGGYDFVLNLSAMKHVRSEKDPYSLMRMIRVNIFNTIKTLQLSKELSAAKYFCVSTDKAANPVNMMGASKRIMEMFLALESQEIEISTARFANVAFSDGSLLHGFKNRLLNHQPISAPNDVRRYFVTPKESGELCLLSAILGKNMETFFPKLSDELILTKFTDIARRFLNINGYEAFECSTEDEARSRISELVPKKIWPVYFFKSDTTGEKDFEEFFTASEKLDLLRFKNIGVIKNNPNFNNALLENFERVINNWIISGHYDRADIVALFNDTIYNFEHKETGKFLDNRM